MEAKIALTAAFSSSAVLRLVSLIFLLTVPYRSSLGVQVRPIVWPVKHSNTTVSKPVASNLGTVGSSPAGKRKSASACEQTETQSALRSPGRWQQMTLDLKKNTNSSSRQIIKMIQIRKNYIVTLKGQNTLQVSKRRGYTLTRCGLCKTTT